MLVKHLLIGAIALLLLPTPKTSAQTPQTRQLDLSLGYGLLMRQDLIFSPFVHEGSSPLHIGLVYRRDKRWQQTWSLRFAQTSAQHQPTFDYTLPYEEPGEVQHTAAHGFTFVDLNYTLGKRIAVRERSTWSLGGAVSADLDALNYNHARISNFGYFMAFDVAVWGRWAYQPAPRHRIEAEAQVPLLAWAARSPYLINDDEFIENTASHRTLRTLGNFIGDGQLAAPDRYQRAALTLRYDFALSRRWHVGAIYRGDWMRYDRPVPLRSAQQQVAVNVSLHF